MTIAKVEKLMDELRQKSDLLKFRDEEADAYCKKNRMQEGQLVFLLMVVAAERMRKGNIEAKQRILNKRKSI